MIGRPTDAEYAPFFAGYVSLVPEADILEALQRQLVDVESRASLESGPCAATMAF